MARGMVWNWKLLSWRILMRVAAIIAVLLVFVYCGFIFIELLFVGGPASIDPQSISTQAEWVAATAYTASAAINLVIGAAVGVAVAAIVTTLAAWQRSKLWLATGVICGAMLLAMLVLVSSLGFATLKSVEVKARDFHTTSVQESPAPRELTPATFTQEEIESEIRTMITVTSSTPAGIKTFDGKTATAAEVPILTDECTSGNFAVPSDEGGKTLERVLEIWEEAGYTVKPDRVSSYLATSETLPVSYADIHDRETINGLIGIRIMGWCDKSQID